MPEVFDPAAIDARVARADPDRHMAARFAPEAARARLIALYAFNDEIARVRERVTEPAIGDIRLAWWREAVAEIYDPGRGVRWHESAQALERAFAGRPPPREWIDGLIDARGRDLEAAPFASLDELRDYARATAGRLMRAAVWMLAPGAALSSEAETAILDAGTAWGVTGLLRAEAHHRAQGRPGLPDDGLAPVIALAREEYRRARGVLRAIPAEAAPAVLYAALIPGDLRRIGKARRAPPAPGPGRRARLVIAALRGRI